MFTNLSDLQKSALFAALVLLLALACALIPSTLASVAYMLVPTLAALVMMLVLTRDGYSREGWRNLGLFNLGMRVWPIALLLPLVLIVGHVTVWQLDPDSFRPFQGGIKWFNTALFFLAWTLEQTVTVSLGEELGWRGYLLPKLVSLGRGRAYLLSGLLWAVWHYPLIFIAGLYNTQGSIFITTLLFTLTLIPLSAVLGELRLSSGSVWPASILHSSHNVIWQLLVSLSTTSPLLTYLAGEAGLIPLMLYSIAALILLQSRKRQPVAWAPSS